MSVQTPFELTGEWTSLADEATFLTALDGVGGVTVTEIGRSTEDRPIWQASVGSGSAVMIVCAQHGTEPATRESAFALVRDLAYRVEPWMNDFLVSNRVVVVPTMCPDERFHNVYSLGGTPNNTNRDFVKLARSETRAVASSMAVVDPDVVLDAHETAGQPGADWRPSAAGMPGQSAELTVLSTEFLDDTESVLAGEGWSTLWYPISLMPWVGLSVSAGAHHRVGILSETVSYQIAPAQRVDISHRVFIELLQWYASNKTAVQVARAASVASMGAMEVTPYPNRLYIGTQSFPVTRAIGYVLHEPLPEIYVDTFGIQVENGVVSLDQPARLIIAALCDPGSSQKMVDASPIQGPAPESTGTGVIVSIDNVRYPVREVIAQVDGLRHPVRSIVSQSGLVRHRV